MSTLSDAIAAENARREAPNLDAALTAHEVAAAPHTQMHLPASTTAGAPLRVAHGVAPTTPVDGDMWSTSAGLFIRIDGVTKTVTFN